MKGRGTLHSKVLTQSNPSLSWVEPESEPGLELKLNLIFKQKFKSWINPNSNLG